MPSSMIFASLVVLWLLILVPAVARHRQEVARPSVAALSGRVLARSPRRRSQEVDVMVERDETVVEAGRVVTATRTAEVQVPSARTELRLDNDGEPTEGSAVDHDGDEGGDWAAEQPDDRLWERPPPRYRAGRGGFDAEAAALTARARYAFRQRVVLAMLVTAVGTGIVAGVALPVLWWVHGAIDVLLVGYLVYLRRQVRIEEEIRQRRLARFNSARVPRRSEPRPSVPEPEDAPAEVEDVDVVEPVRREVVERRPSPTSRVRRSAVVVDLDDEDPAFEELAEPGTGPYRRAVGE